MLTKLNSTYLKIQNITKRNNKNDIFTAFLILSASSAYFVLSTSAREYSHVSPLNLTWYFTFSAEKRGEVSRRCFFLFSTFNEYLMLWGCLFKLDWLTETLTTETNTAEPYMPLKQIQNCPLEGNFG